MDEEDHLAPLRDEFIHPKMNELPLGMCIVCMYMYI